MDAIVPFNDIEMSESEWASMAVVDFGRSTEIMTPWPQANTHMKHNCIMNITILKFTLWNWAQNAMHLQIILSLMIHLEFLNTIKNAILLFASAMLRHLLTKCCLNQFFFFSFLLVCANDFATGVGPGHQLWKSIQN